MGVCRRVRGMIEYLQDAKIWQLALGKSNSLAPDSTRII